MTRNIVFGLVLMVGCGRGDRPAERRAVSEDSSSRATTQPAHVDSAARADSSGRRDTAAVGATVPANDPPCFASHLGLPCQ